VRSTKKARRLGSPAGFASSDLSGLLLQAMAVRRHLGPVMMVVTGMEVTLHLFKT
jgi:hypothetical protein